MWIYIIVGATLLYIFGIALTNLVNKNHKYYKKIYLCILFFAALLVFPNNIVATSNYNDYENYDIYEYVINKYDINIDVKENNVFEIRESIGAYFDVYKHGIFRKLPLKNNIVRLDGTKSQNRVKISDIFVNENYTTYKENDYQVIKIGDANYTLKGQKDYIITYSYNLGKDTGKDYDELYFNLIGNEWDTVIDNVTFRIKMPKEFDESKLGFSKGKEGSIDNDGITYNVDGNIITGEYEGLLYPGEALTVRLELPEGYFVGARNYYSPILILMILIPIICLFISIFLWLKYGKDSQVVEIVEFYPPQNLNSLELGFAYKGKANQKDVTSLLIYLANKGYIKVSEKECKKMFFTLKEVSITKLKEYDGNNEYEKMFMDGLFKVYSSINSTNQIRVIKDTVTINDLYNNFYVTMDKIFSKINVKDNRDKIIEKKSIEKKTFIVSSILLSLIMIISFPIYVYYGFSDTLIAVILVIFYISIYLISLVPKFSTEFQIFLAFCIAINFAILPMLDFGTEFLFFDYLYFVVGILCIISMIFCLKYLPKRTIYGNEILGQIRGFKSFLKTVEKDNLESMVTQNPNYFYDILPYTYVLGISDKWIRKFETINLRAPEWFDGQSNFDVNKFEKFMTNTMSNVENSMSKRATSSSSITNTSRSRSSGGGSSGRGSGGGGGGSW